MTRHERPGLGRKKPDVEQLMEYRDLLVDIVRQQGKGIRVARMGELATTRIGTEYFMPGTMTEWSIPNKQLETKVVRELRYSASMRRIGERAGRLLVLESDSVRATHVQPETFGTKRNIYRFSWNEDEEVFESEVMPIEVFSSAQADAEVMQFEPYGIKDVLSLDQERTAEFGGEYSRFVNPATNHQNDWEQVDEAGFDGLLYRTDIFGKEILAEIAAYKSRQNMVQ